MIACPNHGGSFDCSPFCNVCLGDQEYLPSKIFELVKDNRVTPRQIINLGIWLLEQEITGVNLAVVVDCLASDELKETAAAL